MNGKRILISREFIRELSPRLSPRHIIDALLDHAVSHYLYCPWNVAHHLNLYAAARDALGRKGSPCRPPMLFMDVAADTFCVNRTESLPPDLYRVMSGDALFDIIKGLYQHIWGIDLGVRRPHEITAKLAHLSYLDRNRWEDSARRFALLIEDFLPASKDESETPSYYGKSRPARRTPNGKSTGDCGNWR